MKESKIWGDTTSVWSNGNAEVHRISVKHGGFCSKHKHEHKYNLFYVESGKLLIEIWRNERIVDKTTLHSGESTIVPPCVFHKFTALENSIAIEVYWVALDKKDIIRESSGGISEN
jgi:mannose-6-phosphate isomerase-like protein (cupin superfamily)